MGDRANVAVMLQQQWIDPSNIVKVPLFIYTHWGGQEDQIKGILAGLRNSRGRWADHTYFVRIFVQSALEAMGAESNVETGYGLGLTPSDNGHDYVVVDDDLRMVWVQEDEPTPMSRWQDDAILSPGGQRVAMTFDEFIDFAEECWETDHWHEPMAWRVDAMAREGAPS